MNKRKCQGFTLVELLAVIAIIGILAVITVPIVSYQIRNYRFRLYHDQLESIELAAKNWSSEHLILLPEKAGEEIIVTLGDLKIGGYIDDDVRDPRNKKYFPNSMIVRIIKKDYNYIYELEEGEGTENNVPTVDDKTPTIVLNGKKEVTVSYGETYHDLGAKASRYTGESLDNIVITITKDGEIVDGVNTLELGTYVIQYSVTDYELTSSIERTVIVKDDFIPEKIDFKVKTLGTNFVMVETNVGFVSGVDTYEFSKDNGLTWSEAQPDNIYMFANLKYNTTYILKVRVTAKNGYKLIAKPLIINTSDITLATYTIDSEGWQARKTVTITYPKRESYFVYEYSLDKGVTWTTVESPNETVDILFEHNGSVVSRISDGTNIVTSAVFQVIQVDDKPPVIVDVTGNSATWVTNVTLTVNATDEGSGLHKTPYSFDGGKTWVASNTKKYTKNEVVNIKVRDKTLNETTLVIDVNRVDSTIPDAPIISGGGTSWSSSAKTIEVTKEPETIAGIKNYQYYISTSNTTQTGGKWIDLGPNVKSVNISTNGTRYIYFRAINNAGTIGKISSPQTTKIDTGIPTAPTITGGSNTWSSTAKNISVSKDATSVSGIKNYQYYISTSATGQTGGKWVDLPSGTKNISINTNGTRYIYFRAVNNAGKVGVVSSAQVTKVDTSLPTAPTITGGNDAWTNGNRVITVSKPSTSTSGVKNYQYYVSTSNNGQTGGKWVDLPAGTTSVTISTEGTHYIYIRPVNNAGKVGAVVGPQTVRIDKTKPTLTITPTSVSIVKGQNYNLMTGVTAKDGSDILTSSVTKSLASTTGLNVGTTTVTYTVKDKAGNVTTATRKITVGPVVTNISYAEKDQVYTVNVTGTYKLEAWGAQGANGGGLGGYVGGTIKLTAGTKLTIRTGGINGYNGGGAGQYRGGGATTIQNGSTILLIGAGGGGGKGGTVGGNGTAIGGATVGAGKGGNGTNGGGGGASYDYKQYTNQCSGNWYSVCVDSHRSCDTCNGSCIKEKEVCSGDVSNCPDCSSHDDCKSCGTNVHCTTSCVEYAKVDCNCRDVCDRTESRCNGTISQVLSKTTPGHAGNGGTNVIHSSIASGSSQNGKQSGNGTVKITFVG